MKNLPVTVEFQYLRLPLEADTGLEELYIFAAIDYTQWTTIFKYIYYKDSGMQLRMRTKIS